MILNSFAKLNLYLAVLNKRKDNFHNIETLFEKISLSDKLVFRARRDKKINILCSCRDIPKDNSRNLAYLSAKLLQETFNIDGGADIKLIKRIPVGAGLGGGSSNAATTLIALNKLWRINLSQEKLASLAKKIGSDVPFFIYDTAFAVARGRGDRVKPIKALKDVKFWHIVVVPKIKVLTAFIYRQWDKLGKGPKISQRRRLTESSRNVKILILGLKEKKRSLIKERLFNSLDEVSAALYPEVRRIEERLRGLGLELILMSGSGSAVFAIASSRKEAVSVSMQLKKNKGWQVFVTRTR